MLEFQNKIKIFLDGADKGSILEMLKNPYVKGFTTNPSLVKKAGVTDYKKFALDLLQTVTTHGISFEVFSDDLAEMRKEAMEIASWGANVYVKIPVINTKGESTVSLIKELTHKNVKLNVTAIFTMKQIYDVVEALKGGSPSIVSVFAGRIADTGRDPVPVMSAAADLCASTDKNIELLWASTREAYNVVQAEKCGCHIITAPLDMIKKVSSFGKDLFEMSLDTVRTFKSDIDAAGLKIPTK